MRLLLESLPESLRGERESLARCLRAMDQVAPLSAVYLFGSHARGEAHPESDVDLCLVAEGAERQVDMVSRLGLALWDVWPRPPFTLVPITPQRLTEKQAVGDHFYQTVLNEGVLIATQD